MGEFYCPIHDTYKCETVYISISVDSYNEYYCPQCLENCELIKKFEKWARDTNGKLPTEVKKVMKENSFFVYHECDLMEEVGYRNLQSIDYLFYFKNKPSHISLYECGNILSAYSYRLIETDSIDDVYEMVLNDNFKTSFRIRFQTLGKFSTKEMPGISSITKEVIGNIFDAGNISSIIK